MSTSEARPLVGRRPTGISVNVVLWLLGGIFNSFNSFVNVTVFLGSESILGSTLVLLVCLASPSVCSLSPWFSASIEAVVVQGGSGAAAFRPG